MRVGCVVCTDHFPLIYVDIVGFFRVWVIPEGATSAKEGSFVPATEAQWIEQGTRLLRSVLEASTMLPIGEDLGKLHMHLILHLV